MAWRCADRNFPRVTLPAGVDIVALDRAYGMPIYSGDAARLLPGMEVVLLRSRFTRTSPSVHVCEDAIEGVVEGRRGKTTTAIRVVRINGLPASGIVSVRDDVSERFFFKRKSLPEDGYGLFLDRDRLPWRLEVYVPPRPLPSSF